MPDKHAYLALSASARWLACPPSAQKNAEVPDQQSEYAELGTEAHSLCEYLLGKYLGRSGLVDPRPGMQYYTPEMEECCQGYVSYVAEIMEGYRRKGVVPTVFVEQRVDLRRFIPESMGTSDCVVVGQDELCIVDYKYGMHPVPAS